MEYGKEFQLTRSRGAWQTSSFYDGENKNFNSHAHVERDMVLENVASIDFTFQLTRSRGAWHAVKWVILPIGYFNSHAHVERDISLLLTFINFNDFNSHAHVERDEVQMSFTEMQVISTHTLTWSVTIWDFEGIYTKFISTHTLTWSVTLLSLKRRRDKEFQLTRSRGAWPVNTTLPVTNSQISTHTLTWSVTISADVKTVNNFISTHTLTWSVTI